MARGVLALTGRLRRFPSKAKNTPSQDKNPARGYCHIAGLSTEPSGSWGTLKLAALAAS